jgi:hypothetical protein
MKRLKISKTDTKNVIKNDYYSETYTPSAYEFLIILKFILYSNQEQ